MESTSHTVIDSPVGPLTLAGRGGVLTGVYFRHHWYRPDAATFGPRDDGAFAEAARRLAGYFAGRRTTFDLPVHADGDDFQHAVWRRITAVPYGATTTYGDIARDLGDPSLARDVGAAVGRNPLSIVVPCHRVVGKGGKLTGYAGGLRRKQFLLDLERESSLDGALTLPLELAHSDGQVR
ncbi:MAG TPA: methylated-DNA--[protein]-cysteine S-methyltransferase [Actinophytocola sp.]|jgi:methylated-DNA-[protein]-cysteine S-methyltransferase|nr:methylated-DNA--[protein]-cysteine S-methyltransferase [Actinophytocola sp.]